MLKKSVESFISKIEEKILELAAQNTVMDINHDTMVETLKKNLKALSARALDVADEIKIAEQSGHKKRKREVENWLEEVKELETEICKLEGEVQSEGFVSRFLGGDQATRLKERLVELVEQSRHFGELVLEDRQTSGEELLTTNLVGKAFEENLEKIWNFLMADDVKSIGIYGMGGVGKTTLTKHINNGLVKTTQKCVFWVTVSQEYGIRMLQDKIAHVIGINLSDEDDEGKRASRLYRALSSRNNFVLILDDVWKSISFEKVGIPFHVHNCTLIITTRSFQVCNQIGCQQLVPVKTLDTNEAWNLFSDTLGQTLSPKVEEIAKSMAKLCDGLPLGIITLAGSMRGETAIHVWRNALHGLWRSVMEHDDMEDHVFRVLKYSFDRLNPKHEKQGESNGSYNELQHCFLYCSLFPEDHMIEKKELVKKFISEELVDQRKTRRAQSDQGHTILDKLVNVCLLESVCDSHVKIHDLIRAVALKITRGKNVLLSECLLKQIPNEDEYWTQDVEKMSLMENDIKEIPDGMSPNCPRLSTLILQQNRSLEFISDSFFSQMQGLCVLVLSECGNLTELPNSLSDLKSLKSLILRCCCQLVKVPYLGKLKALKELDLTGTTIREVPPGMDELVNLKFLSMDGSRKLETLPAGLISKFQNLQCLHLPEHIDAPIIEMESLGKLEEFKGRLNNIADFNRLIGCRPLLKYWVNVGSHEYFRLSSCDGVNVVRLKKCKGLSKSLLDDFPKFNNPKSLQTLVKIRNCEGIECILAEMGDYGSHCAPLGTIISIELDGLRDFMGMIQKQEVVLPTPAQAVFSSLRELIIENCHEMKNLGLTASDFPNLKKMYVAKCEEIEEIIDQGGVISFPKLKRLELLDLPNLKHVGLIGSKFPNLESIKVKRCSEIEYIIDQGGVISFPKLKRLELLDLPNLKRVGLIGSEFPNSESIKVEECSRIEYIIEQRGVIYFPKLIRLDLRNLPKLKHVGLTGSEFPNLESINVEECKEIEYIIEQEGVVSFPKLKELCLLALPKLKHVSLTGSEFPNLELIRISGCKEIEEIIEHGDIVSLPKLKELKLLHLPKLKNVGLIGLEFPNLELIHVVDCSEIEEIIEQGGVVSFPKLKLLQLSALPKLKNVGLTGSEFSNLELIHVVDCSEIEEIIEQRGVSFPKLKWLHLWDVPKLKHVGATTICDSIEVIDIYGCRALKKVPLYFQVSVSGGESSNVSYSPPPALKQIYLRRGTEEWWESLEWDHPSDKLLLQPFVKFGW